MKMSKKKELARVDIYTGLVGGRQVDLITRVIFLLLYSLLLFLVGFFCLTVGGSFVAISLLSLFSYLYISFYLLVAPAVGKDGPKPVTGASLFD